MFVIRRRFSRTSPQMIAARVGPAGEVGQARAGGRRRVRDSRAGSAARFSMILIWHAKIHTCSASTHVYALIFDPLRSYHALTFSKGPQSRRQKGETSLLSGRRGPSLASPSAAVKGNSLISPFLLRFHARSPLLVEKLSRRGRGPLACSLPPARRGDWYRHARRRQREEPLVRAGRAEGQIERTRVKRKRERKNDRLRRSPAARKASLEGDLSSPFLFSSSSLPGRLPVQRYRQQLRRYLPRHKCVSRVFNQLKRLRFGERAVHSWKLPRSHSAEMLWGKRDHCWSIIQGVNGHQRAQDAHCWTKNWRRLPSVLAGRGGGRGCSLHLVSSASVYPSS